MGDMTNIAFISINHSTNVPGVLKGDERTHIDDYGSPVASCQVNQLDKIETCVLDVYFRGEKFLGSAKLRGRV